MSTIERIIQISRIIAAGQIYVGYEKYSTKGNKKGIWTAAVATIAVAFLIIVLQKLLLP